MKEFFNLYSTESLYTISFLEKLIPILITIFACTFIYFKKEYLKSHDKFFRYTLAFIALIPLSIFYLIQWFSEGITAFNLPLHLCFFSNILAIILCFNKSKSLFNILMFGGILGGASSLLLPSLDLSFHYFRYYQFMIAHMIIIIIPIYFTFVYNYKVSFKEALNSFVTIEIIGLALGIFNEIFKTNYMFVSFSSSFASDGSALSFLGDNLYILKLQVLYIVAMIFWYMLLNICYNHFSPISKK